MKNPLEFHGVDALLNKMISCQYHNVKRQGQVVKATPTVLTIAYQGPARMEFRSLAIADIQDLQVH